MHRRLVSVVIDYSRLANNVKKRRKISWHNKNSVASRHRNENGYGPTTDHLVEIKNKREKEKEKPI